MANPNLLDLLFFLEIEHAEEHFLFFFVVLRTTLLDKRKSSLRVFFLHIVAMRAA